MIFDIKYMVFQCLCGVGTCLEWLTRPFDGDFFPIQKGTLRNWLVMLECKYDVIELALIFIGNYG